MLICSNSYLLLDHVVFLHLGTVQERYHKEKRSFFYSGTESFKTWNMDKLSVYYFIQIYAADAIGMTRFGVFVSTPKMYKLRCLYQTFWPEMGSNYSAFSFEFVINVFCFLECRESPEFFHIPLEARKGG